MAWNYDNTNLSTTTADGRLNTVRLLVGDTDYDDQQVQDEEILFALDSANDNVYSAGAWVANFIASKYARRVDTTLDGQLTAKYSSLQHQYTKLAKSLEYKATSSGGVLGVAAGGISKTTTEAVRADPDRVPSAFRRDQFKNPPDNYYE